MIRARGISRFISQLLPSEISIILYLLITYVLIFAFYFKLEDLVVHILFRAFVLLVIGALIVFQRIQRNNKTIQTIRLFFPFLILGFIYKETDYLNNLFIAENFDSFLSHLEYSIFGCQPATEFYMLVGNGIIAESMYFGYFSYYVLVIGFPLFLYLRINKLLGEQMVFIIITSFVTYYLFFIIFPAAGPQYYFAKELFFLPNGYFFGPLVKYIQFHGEGATAAFPSSHVGICLMIIWSSFTSAKKLLLMTLPVGLLLITATVYIGAHYLVDVIAAFISAPPIYFLSKWIFQKINILRFKSEQEYEY